jgi:hypothetical protein
VIHRLSRLLSTATIAALLASCSAAVNGTPVRAQPDAAFFFAGDVAAYGQPIKADDVARLKYLRAIRRIDVCGLLTGGTLAKVGELVSVGTNLAFDECDAELKVSGGARRFLSVTLAIAPRDPPPFCGATMPLPLSGLPGAPPLPRGMQPTVWIELVVDTDCKLEKKVGDGLAARLASGTLPPRDSAALYSSPLAVRDPCEVLTVLDGVRAGDVYGSAPHRCQLELHGNGIQVRLQPESFGAHHSDCRAVEFVGPPMQRNVIGVGYVNPGSVDNRPAVVVDDIDGNDCGMVTEVAAKAAALYR